MRSRRQYTEDGLREAVLASESYAGVLRYMGRRITGGSQHHIKTLITRYGIDISHFTGQAHNKRKRSLKRRPAEDILKINTIARNFRTHAHLLRRALIEVGRKYQCEVCGISDWNGQPLVLEVDHINGDRLNERAENLRFICPNCHSQTSTYGSKNGSYLPVVAQLAEVSG